MNDSFDPVGYGLPHREPFIFVGRVEEVEPGVKAICSKIFQPDEAFFRGHFPGNPIVPGVILTEALAQAAGIAAGGGGSRKSYLLSAVRLMKFYKPARPLDVISLHAEKTGEAGGLLQFTVKALVDGEAVAEGSIVLNEV